ncbi:MAG: 4'-phosphopantetheinyl transferase superfamily protein [Lachnospiraceae bacterium]|nr:4'-phosphopantetheinyl transferase superfamily protein [Lachnospiraceae bacterium]
MKTAVYIADTDELKDPELFEAWYERMPEDRKEKIGRLLQEKDRRLSLGAGVLLCCALQDQGLDADDASGAAEGPGGKPCLLHFPDIRFNLAHSGHYALCVIAKNEVGCDIEEQRDGLLRVAERFFSGKEQAYIFSRHGKERKRRAFFRIWTMKESYVKALGEGLKKPFGSFSVLPGKNGTIPKNCAFFEYKKIPGYACSVCVLHRGALRPVFRVVSLKELWRRQK